MRRALMLMLVTALVSGPGAGWAVDAPREAVVVVQNQRFSPEEVRVKAGAPFLLVVTNRDKTAARFESQSLKIEKIVPAGQTVRIRVPALKPGAYPFANGRIVAE
jgi:hypothetical protein